MGNKATYRNLAEEGQRRGIKRQHLLNCFVYKMEAARLKAGSSKDKCGGGEKKKKRELYSEIFLQNGIAAPDFLNKRTPQGKAQAFPAWYSVYQYGPCNYSELASNCPCFTRSQMHVELHKLCP